MSATQDAHVFECRKCGHCCEGRGGIVVSPEDLARLARFFELEPQEAARRYGEISNGKLKLRQNDDGQCIFFSPDRGCLVHEIKPAICRAWPFFRGNLEDAVSLDMARDFCPGISRSVSHGVFVRKGMAYLRANNLLATDAKTEANALFVD